MKIYEVRWSFYGRSSEWHSGDVYYTAGIFTDKNEAEKIKNKIRSLKYEDGRQKYDCGIREHEADIITDNLIRNELEESEGK